MTVSLKELVEHRKPTSLIFKIRGLVIFVLLFNTLVKGKLGGEAPKY